MFLSTKRSNQEAADILFSGRVSKPPVDKDTFIALAKLASKDVVMLTHDGYYRQLDGLAMGAKPAPPLANIWLSKYKSETQPRYLIVTWMTSFAKSIAPKSKKN